MVRRVAFSVFMCITAMALSACGQTEFGSETAQSSVKGSDVPATDIDQHPDLQKLYECGSEPKSKKVLVCHVPPGNPANKHTICISKNALSAHLAHHAHDGSDQDTLGPCDQDEAVAPEETVTERE